MDSLNALLEGFATALQPQYLLYALFGVFIGTAVGVLPGIGPALTVALLLPVTFKLDPTGSLIMFAGIYYGGMYGGSTTSILVNTPGETASVVTADLAVTVVIRRPPCAHAPAGPAGRCAASATGSAAGSAWRPGRGSSTTRTR